jgi:hypothetical protein
VLLLAGGLVAFAGLRAGAGRALPSTLAAWPE